MTRLAVASRQVRDHFSLHADDYDSYAVVQKMVVQRLLQQLPEQVDQFQPALDLGTGTGELARQLRNRFPSLTLAVADIAHGMTKCAKAHLEGVWAFDADAQALPLAPDRFGLLLSSSMYQWINDLPAAFAENFRVLRSGGWFVFALFSAGTLCELREAHRLALLQTRAPYRSHMQAFPDYDEVRRALQRAGFSQLRLESELLVEEHRDVATLLRNLKRIGAQNAAAQRPQGLGSRRVMQVMMETYAEQYGREGTIPATYQVLYGMARKE